MVRKLVALLWPIGLLLPVVTVTPAAAASPRRAQTLIFDAIFTTAQGAGPGPSHVGHRQIVSGSLRAADGRRAGTFSFSCTWTKVTPVGASERCRALALTSDGRLDAAGSSDSGDVTHTGGSSGAPAAIAARQAASACTTSAIGTRC